MNKILLTGILWLAFPGWGNQAQGQLQINASATEICINESVEFTSSSTTDIDEWDWDFGPGASPDESDDDDPEVSYTSPGMKTIKLKVEYDDETVDKDQAQLQIMVFAESVGGVVEGGTTPIPLGESTGTMNLSGETGEVQNWEKSLNNGNYDLIASTSGTSYSEVPSSYGEWRYLAVVKNGACPEAESSSKLIVVQQSSAGSIGGGNSPICQGTSTGTMTISGHIGTIEAWEINSNNTSYSDVPGTTGEASYSSNSLSAGSHVYRVRINDGFEISYSDTREIMVDATTVGGSITGGNTPIFLGESTGSMILSGHTGVVQTWQRSLDNGSFTNIPTTAGLSSYSENPSSDGDWRYQVVVKSGSCPATESNSKLIVVQEGNVGTLGGGNSPICQGGSTGTMTLSGYTGTIESWEINSNNTSFINVPGTSGQASYSTNSLPAGAHLFRVRVTVGSESLYSNTREILVDETSVGGSVAGGTTPIFLGENTGNMTLSGHTGVVQNWQKSLDNDTYTNIPSTAGLTSYSEIPSSDGEWRYRAVVKSGACPVANSGARTIEVQEGSVGTLSGGNSPICQGGSTGTMTLSGYTGTIESWEINSNNTSFINVPGTSGQASYSTNSLPAGAHIFRVRVTVGSESLYSNTREILVDETSVGGSVAGGTTPIFLGENTGNMTLSGHTGVVQNWQKSLDNGTYTNIPSTAGLTSYSENPTSDGEWRYRAVVKSGACPVANSGARTIEVQEVSTGTLNGGNSPICQGTSTGNMTLSNFTGTIEAWEINSNGGGFVDIPDTDGEDTYSTNSLPAGSHVFQGR